MGSSKLIHYKIAMKSAIDILSIYGFFGVIRLVRDFIFTKLFFSNARLVRYPWYLRGKKNIKIGHSFTSGVGLRIDAFCQDLKHIIIIGNNVQINDYVHIGAILNICIGDNTLIASKVFISDHNHGQFDSDNLEQGPKIPPLLRPLNAKPVFIGKNVWIGESVSILPGVSIGDGAVIGAGAVVTRDIPSQCVAVGNPARILRCWDDVTHEWRRT